MDLSRLLLDTHAFLWWRSNDARLMQPAKDAIVRADRVCVSAASAWEVAIKARLGRLDMSPDFLQGVIDSGFAPLLIDFRHATQTQRLPDHHRDPFDRMLIAQAQVEGLVIVTHDAQIFRYDVETLFF